MDAKGIISCFACNCLSAICLFLLMPKIKLPLCINKVELNGRIMLLANITIKLTVFLLWLSVTMIHEQNVISHILHNSLFLLDILLKHFWVSVSSDHRR